jgi:hypothetical protein
MRFARADVALYPPTHRTLEVLAGFGNASEAVAWANVHAQLDPICPKLVVMQAEGSEQTVALVLPGDREHEIADPRVPGRSRFVLRGTQWLPEDAP